MAFDNVNVTRARKALQDLQNSLNYEKEKEICSVIFNEKNFGTTASDPLKNGMKTLIDVRYKELKELILKYQQIVDYVEEYQELERRVDYLQDEIDDEYDDDDTSYSKIRRLKREKRQCLNRMDEIEANVDSMI